MLKRIITSTTFFIVIFNSQLANSAVVASSTMENDSSWTLQTNVNSFYPPTVAVHGFSPSAGSVVMHFNSGFSGQNGTNTITFSGTPLTAGEYTVTIDVGNFRNAPLPSFNATTDIGMTAGGTLIPPTSSTTPTPSRGQLVTWTYIYTITPSNASLGSDIGFSITVPSGTSNVSRNVGFDNLSIDFVAAAAAGSQAIPTLSFWGLGLLTLMLGFWANRKSNVSISNQ